MLSLKIKTIEKRSNFILMLLRFLKVMFITQIDLLAILEYMNITKLSKMG